MPQKLPTAKRRAFLWRGIGKSFQLAIIASRETLIDYDIATAQSWSYISLRHPLVALSVRGYEK